MINTNTVPVVQILVINGVIFWFGLLTPHSGQFLITAWVIEAIIIGAFVLLSILLRGIVRREALSTVFNLVFFSAMYIFVSSFILTIVGYSVGAIHLDVPNLSDSANLAMVTDKLASFMYDIAAAVTNYLYPDFRWVIIFFGILQGYDWLKNIHRIKPWHSSLSYAVISVPATLRMLVIFMASMGVLTVLLVTITLTEPTMTDGTTKSAQALVVSVVILCIATAIKIIGDLFLLRRKILKTSRTLVSPSITTSEKTFEEKTIPFNF